MDEAVGVARVKTDGGFVENIEAAHERTAQRGGEVDALTFTARKRIAQAVEGEIGQAHLLEEAQAGADFGEQPRGHLCLVGREGEGVKPRREFAHGTAHQFGDGRASHPHIEGFGAQSGTVARGAVGLATIAREHDAVLDFVLIFFEHTEERVDADIALAVAPCHAFTAVPQQVALLWGEVEVGLKDGEIVGSGFAHELLQPDAHLLSAPAHHRPIMDGEGTVGHDKTLVDADDAAETLALGAGTHRGVEGKKIVARIFKFDAIGFKAGREPFERAVRIETQQAFPIAFKECRFDRVGEARNAVLGTVHHQAVEQQEQTAFGLRGFVAGNGRFAFYRLVHTHHLAIKIQT